MIVLPIKDLLQKLLKVHFYRPDQSCSNSSKMVKEKSMLVVIAAITVTRVIQTLQNDQRIVTQTWYLGHTCWNPCRYSCSCADIVICLRLNLNQQIQHSTPVIVIARPTCTVLSSWHCHCQSLPSSSDKYSTNTRRPPIFKEADLLEPQICPKWNL